MVSGRSMYLILCRDPKQDQQVNSLLYNLLWDAAYQYDLNKTTKQPQRKAFISHQDDPSDVFEHGSEEEDSTNDHTPDEPFPDSVFQSSFNPFAPKKSTKTFYYL